MMGGMNMDDEELDPLDLQRQLISEMWAQQMQTATHFGSQIQLLGNSIEKLSRNNMNYTDRVNYQNRLKENEEDILKSIDKATQYAQPHCTSGMMITAAGKQFFPQISGVPGLPAAQYPMQMAGNLFSSPAPVGVPSGKKTANHINQLIETKILGSQNFEEMKKSKKLLEEEQQILRNSNTTLGLHHAAAQQQAMNTLLIAQQLAARAANARDDDDDDDEDPIDM